VRLRPPLAALILALPCAGAPQGYDPRFTWRTMESPHFRLHYHDGLEPFARRTAAAAERAHAALVPLLGHAPEGKVELVLSDDTDDANGSATVVPRNVMRLFAVPPRSLSELNDHADWLEALVFHEYTHILHMDNIGGFPRVLNAIFGRIYPPSGLGPPWLLEGIAVAHESPPGAGRNHSALFDMWTRAMVVEGGGLPPLHVVSSEPLDWPRGHAWYQLGGRFLAFLRERCGDAALRAFFRDQGRQLWPYWMNGLAERHLGGSFPELWAAFGEALKTRYRDQLEAVRARPVTPQQPLTRRGADVSGARFAADGRSVVYVDEGLDERHGLRRVGLGGDDQGRLAAVEGNGSFALLPGRWAVVAVTDAFEEYRLADDLHLVDLETGRRQRLTHGERATDPDLDPGGAWVVYVARLPGGEHELRRRRLDGSPAQTLLRRPGAQLFLPRVSPDGSRVALEIQEAGRRDVAVWGDGELRFVTDDDAVDSAPAWSPDGRRLVFASDRSGVYDLYAFELGEPGAEPDGGGGRPRLPGRLRQATRVTGGALQPALSPDGRSVAFLTYSPAGYDLALAPLDPAGWSDPPEPAERPARRAQPPADPPALPSVPYRSLATVGPAWWLPFSGADGAGTTLGLTTGGADVVGLHAWLLSSEWGLRSREPGYGLAYAAGWMHPALSLASSRSVATTPESPARLEARWVPLDAHLTFTRSHLDRVQGLALGWRSLLFRPIGPPPPPEPGAAAYRGASASELSLGLSYGSARRYARSISREEGGLLALRLRFASPDLGGDQSYLSARLSGSGYLRVPFTRHAVLALHASVGAATGKLAGRQPFSLGGMPPPELADLAASALGGGTASQADQLRGYPLDAFSGSTLLSTTAELRVPLLAPSLGHSTWPAMLRRVSGALFLDGGGVFRPVDAGDGRWLGDVRRLRFGAGAEVRLELFLGYRLQVDLRLGVARGLGPLLASSPRPSDPLATTQFYAAVGEPF